jgi:predicted MFS family arabinose efflux permease
MEVASLPAPEHQAPVAGPPAPRHGLALAALSLAAFALPFQNLMIIPTIPTIEAELGLSVVWGTWLVSGFLLVSSVSAPILGRLGDQWGKRRVLNWSLVVFLIGSIGATLAPSGAVLIIFRCLQGSGGAILPLGYSIVKDELPPERLTRAIGILTAVGSLGFGVAVTVSGLLVDALGWRPLFALSALIVAAACVGSFLFVPDSSIRVRAKPDVPGAVVLAAALVSLLLALTEGNHLGWGSAPIIGGLVLAAVCFTAWVALERRTAEPMVDIAMLKRRPVLFTNVASAIGSGFGMTAVLVLLPPFLSAPGRLGYGFDASAAEVGLLMFPWALAGFAGAWSSSWIARKAGASGPQSIGGAVMAVGIALIGFEHRHQWEIVLGLALAGWGFTLANNGAINLIVRVVRPSETGAATGMSTVIRQIGSSLGTQISAAIVAGGLIAGTQLSTESAYTAAFTMAASGALLSSVLARFARPPRGELV